MELYNLKRGDLFKIVDEHLKVPLAHPLPDMDKVYLFDHLDGMYSYCLDGEQVVHFAAWTEVEKA